MWINGSTINIILNQHPVHEKLLKLSYINMMATQLTIKVEHVIHLSNNSIATLRSSLYFHRNLLRRLK